MLDLLIKNGEIIDGSGEKPFKADIGLKDGCIHIISPEINMKSRETIDAKGNVVSPGFIDIHAHSDFTLLINPKGESKIRQGITTEVNGNCGFTAAPVVPEHFQDLMQCLKNTVILTDEEKKKWKWETQADFIEQIGEQGTSFNIAPLVGHATIRVAAMGFENRKPSNRELNKMLEMLQKEMDRGFFGFSTGLEYDPGSFATLFELVEMGKLVKEFDGIYSTHMRSEGDKLLESISEAIQIAEKSGVSLEISHFKAEGPKNWGMVKDGLKMIDVARENGVNVDFDQHPYTAYGSGLIDLIPPWAREQGSDKMLEIFKKEIYVEKIIKEMASSSEEWENPMEGCSWDSPVIASLKKNHQYEGKSINQISKEMNCSPYQAVIELLIKENAAVKMMFFGAICEDDVQTVMKHPRTIFCTDGRAVAPYGKLSEGKIHPRYYGAYPKILGRYVREKQIISLEEAIKKMTLLPALKMKFKDRGLLKEGYHADLVIFDKDKILDLATFQDPHKYPQGIDYVIVNGNVVISKGEHTGKLPGKILRKND